MTNCSADRSGHFQKVFELELDPEFEYLNGFGSFNTNLIIKTFEHLAISYYVSKRDRERIPTPLNVI